LPPALNDAPFVYQLGSRAFIAWKPGQHRQGVPLQRDQTMPP